MKPFKIIFISFLLLSILISIFALLIPSSSKISRAITIKANKKYAMSTLQDLNTWQHWHPFLKNKNVTIQHNTLSYANYKMHLLSNNDSTLSLLSENPEGLTLPSTIAIYDSEDSCSVNWYSNIKVKWYPWEKFRSIFYDNILGAAIDSNLLALKIFLESKN